MPRRPRRDSLAKCKYIPVFIFPTDAGGDRPMDGKDEGIPVGQRDVSTADINHSDDTKCRTFPLHMLTSQLSKRNNILPCPNGLLNYCHPCR